MGTMTIFWSKASGRANTVLNGVSKEEFLKAEKAWHLGENLFISYSPYAGVVSVFGTSNLDDISSMSYEAPDA